MRRPVSTLTALAAVLAAVAVAVAQTFRTATAQGWLEDGYHGLVRDAFCDAFDRVAPIALVAWLVLAMVVALVRRRRPARADLAGPLALAALVVVARGLAAAYDRLGPPRPNVLLVSIDTLRSDRLGAYGYERPTSPAVDRRLAAEGVVFENAWSQSPKTTPSHMTMLTSLYPSVHGVPLWEGKGAAPSLNPRVDTLAEVLKDAGYATAAFTAGGHVHRDRGFVQGFDVYKHGDQVARALDFLRHRGRRPFFLFFHTYEVHDPYTPPPRVAVAFAADPVPAIADAVARIRAGVPGWSQAHKLFWQPVDPHDARHVRYVSDLYDAGIHNMATTTLPTLLDALDRLGLADRTLVVFTSDHGEEFQEHGRFLHDDLFPETLRVPLVLRLPGVLAAGRRVPDPVGLVDVTPTVLDLVGLAVPAQAQGRSLATLARDGTAGDAPRPVFSEYSLPGRPYETVRLGSDTLVREGATLTLFDRARDPDEHDDVAAAEPARVASLRALLDRWHDECARLGRRYGPRPQDVAAPSPETLKQLRALGYVE